MHVLFEELLSYLTHRYTGHCPQARYSFGETFGDTSGNLLYDYRQRTLSNSKERFTRGGDVHIPFPIYYQNDPTLVVGTTTRTHRRWESAEKYKLHNQSPNENRIYDFKLVTTLFFIDSIIDRFSSGVQMV